MKITSTEKYEKDFVVQASDIDQLGHVNNVVYLQWVQDVATEAWYSMATTEQKEKLIWVVAKHTIEYIRPAFESEELIIRTWVGEADKNLFTRFTEVVRKKDSKLVIKALTYWVPVDIKTMRPTKVGDDVYQMFSVSD